MSFSDAAALKIHGYVFDTSSISDGGKSDFDEEYYAMKPPPIPADDLEGKVIKIYPKHPVSAFRVDLEDFHNPPQAEWQVPADPIPSETSTTTNHKRRNRGKSLPREKTNANVGNGEKSVRTSRPKKRQKQFNQFQPTYFNSKDDRNNTFQVKPIFSDIRNLSTSAVSSSIANNNENKMLPTTVNASSGFIPANPSASQAIHRPVNNENKMLPTTVNASSAFFPGSGSKVIHGLIDNKNKMLPTTVKAFSAFIPANPSVSQVTHKPFNNENKTLPTTTNVTSKDILKEHRRSNDSNGGTILNNNNSSSNVQNRTYADVTRDYRHNPPARINSNLHDRETNIQATARASYENSYIDNHAISNDSTEMIAYTEPKSFFHKFMRCFFCC